mgnify:CR=1 FL=1
MSAIKIYVDSIEIDFVRSTLSLKKENPSKQIDISFLPVGVYAIEIKGLTSKFIKQ